MTTAECHHRFDSFDTGLIRDYPSHSAFQWYLSSVLSGFGNILNGRDDGAEHSRRLPPGPSHPG
jgi:hypothetical protein